MLTGAAGGRPLARVLGVTDVFGLPGGAILPVLRPAHGLDRASATSWCATSRAPATRPRATPRHPARSASRSRPPAPARPTSSPRSPTRTWTRCRSSHHRPGVLDLDGHGRLPGGRHRRHHDADHEALVPRDATRRTCPATIAAAYQIADDRPPRPGARRHHEGRPAEVRRRSSGRRRSTCPATARSRRRTASRSRRRRSCSPRRRSPVLYVGGGVIRSQRVGRAARSSPRRTGAPVVTTLMARGAFPDSHPQHLGMPGMHGTVPAVLALQEADLLISLGARFDDRVTGKAALFAPEREGRARRHRPGRDRQDPRRRRADRGRREGRASSTSIAALRATRRRRPRPTSPSGGRTSTGCATSSRSATRSRPTACSSPQYVIQRIGELTGPEGDLRRRRRPAPDVGGAVHQVRAPERLAQLRRRRHHGLRGARRRWAPRSPSPTASCGRSTATAASR